MHSKLKGRTHDIIFTQEELENYGQRLYSLYEKGFRYRLIPHLSGVQLRNPQPFTRGQIVRGKRERKPVDKVGVKVITELYDEGYFVAERKFGDVCKEVERRGGEKIRKSTLFNQLTGLVRQKKLFKTKYEDGYKFKQR